MSPRRNDPESAPSLTVAAVARRLGVAPATLRTWDRRYGLGPSAHLAGSHRRYSSADVGRLVVMRRLTLEGVAPSEAARAALASSADGAEPSTGDVEVIDAFSDAAPMAPDPKALVAAAAHFDSAAMRWMLARVHPRDTLAWWSELVEPAVQVLEERTHLDRPGESVVAALTAAVFAELRSRAAVADARARNDADGALAQERPTVLALAVAGGSVLLVHVLATALQARGAQVWVLSGHRRGALAETFEKVRPAAVVVELGPDDDADATAPLHRAVELGSGIPVFVHRRGSAPVDLPASGMVHRVRTLTGALHELLAVLR